MKEVIIDGRTYRITSGTSIRGNPCFTVEKMADEDNDYKLIVSEVEDWQPLLDNCQEKVDEFKTIEDEKEAILVKDYGKVYTVEDIEDMKEEYDKKDEDESFVKPEISKKDLGDASDKISEYEGARDLRKIWESRKKLLEDLKNNC